MNLYQINIHPSGGFYSEIKGDMLFGMFCSAIVDKFGQNKLDKYLEGYMQNAPFVVFSDAFPKGYVPKPTLPYTYYKQESANTGEAVLRRKEFKRKNWLPADKAGVSSLEMSGFFEEVKYISKELKTSVRLDPETHRTTGGKYSAYTLENLTYTQDLSLYVLIDETRITPQEVQDLLLIIGQNGYGKKASAGCGKFEPAGNLEPAFFASKTASSYLTLAPCVPQKDMFDGAKSFYHIFVRFGKHGGIRAKLANPFKKPVLTAQTGAVFTLRGPQNLQFIGCGIGNISQSEPKTVFQGYAPVIPLDLTEISDDR